VCIAGGRKGLLFTDTAKVKTLLQAVDGLQSGISATPLFLSFLTNSPQRLYNALNPE
jgi:hypothetical protein